MKSDFCQNHIKKNPHTDETKYENNRKRRENMLTQSIPCSIVIEFQK